MTFIYRRDKSHANGWCIFELHSSGMPELNEHLKEISGKARKLAIYGGEERILRSNGYIKLFSHNWVCACACMYQTQRPQCRCDYVDIED